MLSLLKTLEKTEKIEKLIEISESGKREITIGGVTDSMSSFLIHSIFRQANTPALVVSPAPLKAEAILDDIIGSVSPENVGYFPPMHLHPFDTSALAVGPMNERIEAFLRFFSGTPSVVVTQPETLLQPVPDKNWLNRHVLNLRTGEEAPREILLAEMTDAGYQRESMLDSQGQYAVRGGILDLFPYGFENPLRIEFFGDEIESIRYFDCDTQRSKDAVNEVTLFIGKEPDYSEADIFSLLDEKTVIFWLGMEEIEARYERFIEQSAKALKNGAGRNNYNPAQLEENRSRIARKSTGFKQIKWYELVRGQRLDVEFDAAYPYPFIHDNIDIIGCVKKYLEKDYQVWVTCDTKGEKERLDDLFYDCELENIFTINPELSAGFDYRSEKIAVLTAHELFNRRRLKSRHTRFRRRKMKFDRLSLKRGDLVVHADYGIGKYEGLQMVKIREQPRECLRIRYADDVILYVKVDNFSLVEKYTGMESVRPALTKIGTKEWERAKKKTRKAIEDMTEELLALYAKRKVAKGVAYPSDTHWQREMENSFEFEDTPDQITTTAEIKQDLLSPHPMDRLLSGDVGFGKTEVAIRAAFKVVQESYQAAVLAPTTILAQQHYETFRGRLAPYPIKIEVLSRFKTASEQKKIVKKLSEGEIDILIGTHRILSRDVDFKKLGLLIVDEEHRFGVRHKERIKQMKTSVDVLTMTATPIPRTLHMALMGARDTSQINTPPVNRLPIQTEVHPWSQDLIKYAIMREIDRQGQVFFLHNRVESIYAVKDMLERLVPGVRYAVGHGQMKEKDLERVMFDFMRNRYDVLVTTMIIESGLDIPNANTLIVNRADMLGLAQLYQVRGRIGRSNRQAYAYLLTPPKLTMTSNARRRLATLSEYTDLGSGFKIAMRDLEIRGAGNLLGSQQSGFINAVGFDLYTKMLNEAVESRKGGAGKEEQEPEAADVKIEYKGAALFPADYIDDGDIRYDFYRKLSNAADLRQIDAIAEELEDRFGKLPEPAGNLLAVARLKIMSVSAGFEKVEILKNRIECCLKMPPDQESGQKLIGKLVAKADPMEVEFKIGKNVLLIHRFNSKDGLKETLKFLRHVTREGILQD